MKNIKILDVDLDYFMDAPACNICINSKERLIDEKYIKGVWKRERVERFLEDKLGLSKKNKIKGRIVKYHDEAISFWDELEKKKMLKIPFSVVHVDSHADLSFSTYGMNFVLNTFICWPDQIRRNVIKDGYEDEDGKFQKIDAGNYLLFSIGLGWIKKLIYCPNPNGDAGDIPTEILDKPIEEKRYYCLLKRKIKLKPNIGLDEEVRRYEKIEIPLTIIQNPDKIQFNDSFDFVVVAQSPNYTPEKSDYIIDIFKEYIDEI